MIIKEVLIKEEEINTIILTKEEALIILEATEIKLTIKDIVSNIIIKKKIKKLRNSTKLKAILKRMLKIKSMDIKNHINKMEITITEEEVIEFHTEGEEIISIKIMRDNKMVINKEEIIEAKIIITEGEEGIINKIMSIKMSIINLIMRKINRNKIAMRRDQNQSLLNSKNL